MCFPPAHPPSSFFLLPVVVVVVSRCRRLLSSLPFFDSRRSFARQYNSLFCNRRFLLGTNSSIRCSRITTVRPRDQNLERCIDFIRYVSVVVSARSRCPRSHRGGSLNSNSLEFYLQSVRSVPCLHYYSLFPIPSRTCQFFVPSFPIPPSSPIPLVNCRAS